jgi:hypothetical protein
MVIKFAFPSDLYKLDEEKSTLGMINEIENILRRVGNILQFLCNRQADDYAPVVGYILLKNSPIRIGSYIK